MSGTSLLMGKQPSAAIQVQCQGCMTRCRVGCQKASLCASRKIKKRVKGLPPAQYRTRNHIWASFADCKAGQCLHESGQSLHETGQGWLHAPHTALIHVRAKPPVKQPPSEECGPHQLLCGSSKHGWQNFMAADAGRQHIAAG